MKQCEVSRYLSMTVQLDLYRKDGLHLNHKGISLLVHNIKNATIK